MNILLLSTWYPYPPDNGSKIRAYYLIRALRRQHNVILVAFDRESLDGSGVEWLGVDDHDLEVTVRVFEDPFRYVTAPQIVKFISPIPLVSWPNRAMQKTIDEVVSKYEFDVVIALQGMAAIYTRSLRDIPSILDVDVSRSYQRYEAYKNTQSKVELARHWLGWKKAMRFEKALFSRFDACTFVNREETTFFMERFQNELTRFETSKNGVDIKWNHLSIAEKNPLSLVYNGSLTYNANYDAIQWFLAEIYQRIKIFLPQVSLTVTGSIARVDLDGLVLDGSVQFTGHVEDVRIPVAEAVVCVVPIRQGSGTRLKILEAMALGTPVVATPKAAEGLEIINGENILLADDPDTFAASTVELLDNPERCAYLAGNARRLVEERYDWKEIGWDFVHLVEQTVAQKEIVV